MVDGELNFITKLDKTGFEKGTKAVGNSLGNLKSSLKSLAKIAAAAFSVKMIYDYAKASKEAYNVQIEQETKLATIMKQRMGATDDVIDSVKQLASEQQKLGVIGDEVQLAGAQQVATFLTQADSIKTLLPAMNDLLAQQRGLEASTGDAVNIANLMGKVLQGQTSALKRVGISFSDAEEQVLKYGSESQRAAMLAQVITNNVGHMNQALAQTDAGKQKQLANTMGDVKEQFGQAVMQIESVFLPVIQLLANGLSKVASIAQAAGNAIKEAFGVESDNNSAAVATATAAAAASAAQSYDDMADSAEQTKKAQENSLASFDKVIKLGDSKKDSGTSSGGSSGENTSTITPVNPTQTKQDTSKLIESIKSGFSELSSWLKTNFGGTFSGIWDGLKSSAKDSWANVKQVFGDVKELGAPLKRVLETDIIPFVNNSLGFIGKIATDTWDCFNKAFKDIWDLAVYPMLQNFVTVGLPLLSDFFGGMLTIQQKTWDVIVKLWNMLWDDVAKPVLEGISGLWNDLWTIASKVWAQYGKPIVDAVSKAIEWIGTTIKNLWNSLLKPIWDWLCNTVSKLWKDHLSPLVQKIGEFIGELVLLITNLWNNVLAPVVNWIVKTFGPVISKIITSIGDVVGSVIGTIIDVVSGVVDFFKGVVKFFSGVFSLDMGKAWDGIKTMFKGAWDAIKAVFSGVVSFFKTTFQGAWNGIKAIWSGVKTFFGNIWSGIKSVFSGVAAWFKDRFRNAWNGIKAIWNGVKTFFSNIWSGIKSVFSGVAAWFKRIFQNAWNGIKSIWNGVKGFFSNIWSGIKSVFSGIKTWFSKIFSGAWSGIKNVFKGVGKFFGDLWDLIKKPFVKVASWFGEKFSKAWDGITKVFTGVGKWFSDLWDKIKQPFIKVATWFEGIFSDAWRLIKDVFKGIGSWFSDRWDDIKKPFIHIGTWFQDKFEDAKRKIKEVWDKIKEIILGVWESIKWIFESLTGADDTEIKKKARAELAKQGKTYTDAEWEKAWKTQKFAKGGVVDRATMAMIGEDGAEVVMPLEKNTGWIDKLARMIAVKQRSMPKLASGTVIPANFGRFAAILGDNKKEPEVVSPLSTMRQAVLEAMAMQKSKQPVKIDIYLDTRHGTRLLSRQLIDDINDIITSTGKVPIKI